MSTSDEISILQALEQEKGMMQRQALLKRLWRLKQQQVAADELETPGDNATQSIDVTLAVPAPIEHVSLERAQPIVGPQNDALCTGLIGHVSP